MDAERTLPDRNRPPLSVPASVVGQAIQKSTVPRLGRGFLPAGVTFVVGVLSAMTGGVRDRGTWILVVGSLVTAAAMLAFGMRVVQRAFGRPHRPWMTVASVTSVLPPAFGVYVLAWPGLRAVAGGGGWDAVVTGVFMSTLGVWLLRSWLRLMEVQHLADVMVASRGPTGERA